MSSCKCGRLPDWLRRPRRARRTPDCFLGTGRPEQFQLPKEPGQTSSAPFQRFSKILINHLWCLPELPRCRCLRRNGARTCALTRLCLWPHPLYDLGRKEQWRCCGRRLPGSSSHLTCQLSQDLFNGHTTGEGVSVRTVGGDQVVARHDGGLDACCTSFLQHPRRWKTERVLSSLFVSASLESNDVLNLSLGAKRGPAC